MSLPRKMIFCLTSGPGLRGQPNSYAISKYEYVNMNSGSRNRKQTMKLLKKQPQEKGGLSQKLHEPQIKHEKNLIA